MIVAEPTGRRWKPDEETEQMAPQLSGLMVIVVVAGRYNGPNHKSLGDCEAGQQIVIPPGPYAEYLLEQGLVRLHDEEPETDPGPADAPTPDAPDNEESAPKRRGRKKA